MDTGIRVGDVMTKTVITVDVRTSLVEAGRLIKKHRVGSAIVMDAGKPVGIVTERDMVEKSIAEDRLPSQTTAAEVMSAPLLSVTPDTSVYDASRLMLQRNIRRLAVVDDRNDLVGIVTVVDILSVSQELVDIYDELIHQRRRRPHFTAPEPLAAEDYVQGICESCGTFSGDLVEADGRLLCESCRSYMAE